MKTQLHNLVHERMLVQQQLKQLDEKIALDLKQLVCQEFKPVCSKVIESEINANKGNLLISEIASFAGVSVQTYYNAIKNVDVVSVGKLNNLLGSIGLQLFVGKKLK